MEKNRLQCALELRQRESPEALVDLIDTNFHRNGFLFPETVLSGLVSDYLAHRDYHPDPKGSLEARRSIRGYYRREGIEVDEERIFITASTSESYSLLFTSLAEPGDTILLPRPTYPLFEYLAQFSRLQVRYYDMLPDTDFAIDLPSVKAGVDGGARFLVLISPNNPTGGIVTEEHLQAVLDLCARRGTMVIADEVFSEFRYRRGPASAGGLPRPAALHPPVPVFTLNGISKMFACPDLKLAWIVASGLDPSSELAERIELANDTFLNCSSLSQAVLPGLFAGGLGFQQQMIAEITARRAMVLDILDASPLRAIPSAGGIHLMLEFDPSTDGAGKRRFSDDEELAVAILNEAGVYLHPGYFYGMDESPGAHGRLYLVMSFLSDRERLTDGLRRVRAFLEGVT